MPKRDPANERAVDRQLDRRPIVRWVTAATISLALATIAAPAFLAQEHEALAILSEFDKLASAELWPGFDPRSTPVAIYDGHQTWLFRHPSPPSPFRSYEGTDEAWVMDGWYPDVRANSSAEIEGLQTATLIARQGEPDGLAAVLIHESFHVFQAQRHPDWTANEVELFVYPLESAGLLAFRRLETEALRRSLGTTDDESRLCWVTAALSMRRARFALMPPGSVEYERGLELKEGLANYVEIKATGQPPLDLFPLESFSVSQVRDRSYATGSALALSLDQFDPGWPSRLELLTRPLDELLLDALSERSPEPCEFSGPERRAAEVRARADVAALVGERDESKREFLSQPGWKIVVSAAPNAPLWPQNFDPLNVERLSASEVIHTRWLKLQGSGGAVEVLDRRALTVGAGAHPLFNGVREVIATGFGEEPASRQSGDTLYVEAPGFNGWFPAAVAERGDNTLVIHLATSG
jgi:hypothetical protein